MIIDLQILRNVLAMGTSSAIAKGIFLVIISLVVDVYISSFIGAKGYQKIETKKNKFNVISFLKGFTILGVFLLLLFIPTIVILTTIGTIVEKTFSFLPMGNILSGFIIFLMYTFITMFLMIVISAVYLGTYKNSSVKKILSGNIFQIVRGRILSFSIIMFLFALTFQISIVLAIYLLVSNFSITSLILILIIFALAIFINTYIKVGFKYLLMHEDLEKENNETN